MKKLLSLVALAATCFGAQAQSTVFKPFKVDVATGYAAPSGKGSKAGFILAFEPKYGLTDNVSVGLRMEAAVMARAYVRTNGMFESAEVKASGSYLATGDYYFNTNRFRPFAGAGFGLYRIAGANVDKDGEANIELDPVSRFGVMPRVGFEFGHFRTAVEYNVVGKVADMNSNYLGVKMGFFFGGGRKPQEAELRN